MVPSPQHQPHRRRRAALQLASVASLCVAIIVYFSRPDINEYESRDHTSLAALRRSLSSTTLADDTTASSKGEKRSLSILPRRKTDADDFDIVERDGGSMKDAPRLLSMLSNREQQRGLLSLQEAALYAEFSGMIQLALGSGLKTKESSVDHIKLVPTTMDDGGPKDGRTLRELTKYLGNGQCEWEEGQPVTTPVFSTFLVGFPGTGKRLAWQLMEALTGAIAGDDWNHSEQGYNVVSMKGAFPHHESSQWLWSDQMNQAILMIRNPRDTLISYRDVRYEINYAPTWGSSHPFNMFTYLKQEPIANFDQWKRAGDTKYGNNGHLEIRMWSWHIDWWMEGGHRRNLNHDVEMTQVFNHTNENGTSIFNNVPVSPPQYWKKCADGSDPVMECRPAAVVSFEGLHSSTTGPSEMAILGNALLGKQGVEVIPEDAWPCVFEQATGKTMEYEHRGMDYRMATEGGPLPKTWDDDQIQQMIIQMEYLVNKFSQPEWVNGPLSTQSQKLVSILNGYLAEPYFANHVYTGPMPEDDTRFPDGQIEASYTLEQLLAIGDQVTSGMVLNEQPELTLPTE